MPVERDEWQGSMGGRTELLDPVVIEMPLAPSAAGGSGTFLADASDGRRWWVKPLNNLQGPKVVVTEYVVGTAGAIVGTPVCEVAIVRIPDEIAGWEFRPGATLEPGLAHASRAVDGALEGRALDHRDRDDNRRRHAGVFALYDWCWGGDDQWLYCETDDRKLYSHDHGWYLPENGPDWSEASLVARVDEPHSAVHPAPGLDNGEIERLADKLRSPLRAPLTSLLRSVPPSWPATDGELETLGFFLERRAPSVAGRLRSLMGGTS
ncbi:MAG: hypothetical protein M3P85_00310 [Actinomycetota bacterium]|nr:hypothetical protein [Actinomycetota bacterium]